MIIATLDFKFGAHFRALFQVSCTFSSSLVAAFYFQVIFTAAAFIYIRELKSLIGAFYLFKFIFYSGLHFIAFLLLLFSLCLTCLLLLIIHALFLPFLASRLKSIKFEI